MKKFTCLGKLMVVLATLLLVSCNEFIPDPVDPRLSMYTEDGRNVSSAIINNEKWIAESKTALTGMLIILPVLENKPRHYMMYDNDKELLTFKIEGQIEDVSSTIRFELSHLGIKSFDNLGTLSKKKIPLDGQAASAFFKDTKADSGQIYFHYVKVEDKVAILSGTFGFTTHTPATKVSYGRFDAKLYSGERGNFIMINNSTSE